MTDAVDDLRRTLVVLSGTALAVFVLFFVLKDGGRMWQWVLSWTPPAHRPRADGAGRTAWDTLRSSVRGTVVIALVDAAGIGVALVLLDVSLALSLTLLVLLGALVPVLGATMSGALAVLVAPVTPGEAAA